MSSENKKSSFIMPALILCLITLVAGLSLAGVYQLTKDTIAEQKLQAARASYKEVCPAAASFNNDEAIDAKIAELDGGVYGTEFGKSYIRQVFVAVDEAGNECGYVVCAESGNGYDGTIGFSLGFDKDMRITGISFTELHESAGMGMLCDEPEFKNQFIGAKVEKFTLNKAGGSTAEEEIDSVSGASVSSGAVVNAVNAALDFLLKVKGV